MTPVSASTGSGVDKLLEAVSLGVRIFSSF
ncbi:MAG: hypothetical protein CM15mP104_0670 [Gammaproteobacteria bacterium]|nr:MAG: hypothetical protein CM15mP104_0670 [Gammaproteobacteria bacterium]